MLQILVGFSTIMRPLFSHHSFIAGHHQKQRPTVGNRLKDVQGSGSVTIWRWCHEPLTWKKTIMLAKRCMAGQCYMSHASMTSIHHASMKNLNFPPDFKYIPSQMSWYFEFWLLLQWVNQLSLQTLGCQLPMSPVHPGSHQEGTNPVINWDTWNPWISWFLITTSQYDEASSQLPTIQNSSAFTGVQNLHKAHQNRVQRCSIHSRYPQICLRY